MTWQEVGDGVFRRRYASFDLNCGLVVGSGACLLVDTRSTVVEGEELRRDLRHITRLPVAAVVNTHAHFDHSFGNAVFRGAPVWGHAGCRSWLVTSGEADRSLKAQAARDAGWPAFAEDMEATPIVAPDRVFEREATVFVGGRTVRLRYLGRGHTDHDLVVEVPDCDVVFAGDLVEEGADPVMGDAWPHDWPETLGRLAASARGVVVPGHGDVVNAAFVASQRDQLRAVAVLVDQVLAGELDEEAAVRRSPLGERETRTAIGRARTQLA